LIGTAYKSTHELLTLHKEKVLKVIPLFWLAQQDLVILDCSLAACFSSSIVPF
jgi:hypothetical protein